MAHPEDQRPMSAYKCDHCGKWHIGHERKTLNLPDIETAAIQEAS